MKKIYFILCFQLAFLAIGYTQVIPKGINYQAVARNLKGETIPNQKVELKIYLFDAEGNRRTNHYSEIHEVTTNGLGLFNLIIGEGTKDQGEYGLIPWNVKNIWMEVALKDKGQSEFATVSSSKLQAVPYAIHAGTANKLVDKKHTSGFGPADPGVVSNTWSVFGNAMTNTSGNPYHINSLGTTDNVDLILITDNVQRLTILAGGDIITKLNFEVGQNLKVGQNLNTALSATIGDSMIAKKNVLFNTLGGSTINYGPFTVAKMSPALLSGKLTVDLATDLNASLTVNGPADLNDSLRVNNLSPTKLTGTLQVDSTTDLNDVLNVNNISPTILSGTLLTDSSATFKDRIKILSQYSTDTSGLVPTGSLQVGGGAYIKENLYVGGIAKFGGPVAFGGAVSITDMTQSTSPTTGALKIVGGVGIGLNLNVGGAAMIGGMMTVKDLTESIDSTTGALKVLGGAGIRKRLNTGGAVSFGSTLQVQGITTLNNSLNVNSGDKYIVHFKNTSNNNNGISIQINNAAPGWPNNFVEFRKNNGGVVGRIEGENDLGTKIEYINIPGFGVIPTIVPDPQYTHNEGYLREIDKLDAIILSAVIAEAIAVGSLGAAILSIATAIASVTGCVGLGIMTCAPIISFIVKAFLDVATFTVGVIAATIGLLTSTATKESYVEYKKTHVGVTYESGNGDYAEWLPKADPNESFLPGYIVGLNNGKITKNTDGSGKVLVISTQPIVLGNMPEQSKELPFEKVAFLGQVPVHVLGQVNTGDYILPSGDHDGMGRAVPPAKMQVEDYASIVGVAWSASTNHTHNLIKVAIGLNGGDMSKVVIEQKNKIQKLTSRFNKRNELLAELVPGFKEAVGPEEIATYSKTELVQKVNQNQQKISSNSNALDYSRFEITNEQLTDLLDKTEKLAAEKGADLSSNRLWQRIKTEPGFKDKILAETRRKVNVEVTKQLEKLKPHE